MLVAASKQFERAMWRRFHLTVDGEMSCIFGQPMNSKHFSAELTADFEVFIAIFSLQFTRIVFTMSFSSLVSDLTFKDSVRADTASQVSKAKSYASTAATSVSISGDISSQLHGGYSHPLARVWQAERQLTKVRSLISTGLAGD